MGHLFSLLTAFVSRFPLERTSPSRCIAIIFYSFFATRDITLISKERMETEKPPSFLEADIGIQQIPAAESVPAHQPPGEESKDAEKRAASPTPPTAEHNKNADHQPVLEAATTSDKAEEKGPQSPSTIAPVRPRIYERYEQDAEVRFSYSLPPLPPNPPKTH